MTKHGTDSLAAQLEKLAMQIGGTSPKTAATEAPTSHPSGDHPKDPPAATGSYASEQSTMLSADAMAPTVDDTPELKPDEYAAQINQTRATMSGDDPAVEDNYEAKMKDPGTSHPATAGGEKYASYSYADLVATFSELANCQAAFVANGGAAKQAATSTTAAAPANPATPAAAAAAPPPATPQDPWALKVAAVRAGLEQQFPEAQAAIAEGYKFAADLGLTMDAAQAQAAPLVAQIIKQAAEDADLVAGYLQACKQAMDEENTIPDDGSSEPSPASEGGAPSDASEPPAPEAAPPMEGGGMPADILGAGGPPAGEEPGGAGGEEEALQQLVAALMEMGVTPEMLLGAGGPAPDAPGMTVGDKMAATVGRAKRASVSYTEAPQGTSRRAMRDRIKKAVAEMLRR